MKRKSGPVRLLDDAEVFTRNFPDGDQRIFYLFFVLTFLASLKCRKELMWINYMKKLLKMANI